MRLLLLGAGGHGRVVADAATAAGPWTEVTFLDDRFPSLVTSGAWPVVGPFDELERMAASVDGCVPAVGDSRLRLILLDRAARAGVRIPTVVHPRATISPNAVLGEGTVAFAGSVVNPGATLGRGCIVNTGATVDHDCVLGDGVHVCPGAHLAGDVAVGAHSWIGIGAVAKQGIRIGSSVMVGAGAACVRDVRDGATVVGVPARERT